MHNKSSINIIQVLLSKENIKMIKGIRTKSQKILLNRKMNYGKDKTQININDFNPKPTNLFTICRFSASNRKPRIPSRRGKR